jgi:hypothetical protein
LLRRVQNRPVAGAAPITMALRMPHGGVRRALCVPAAATKPRGIVVRPQPFECYVTQVKKK